MMYYNFVKLHSKLHTSPAMAAGVSQKLWEIGGIVRLKLRKPRLTGRVDPIKKASRRITNCTWPMGLHHGYDSTFVVAIRRLHVVALSQRTESQSETRKTDT